LELLFERVATVPNGKTEMYLITEEALLVEERLMSGVTLCFMTYDAATIISTRCTPEIGFTLHVQENW
jgi:hypothetical protein